MAVGSGLSLPSCDCLLRPASCQLIHMADHLDALLELTPARKMRAKFSGESLDTAHQGSSQAARIEISFFRFGNAKSLAKAKSQRDRDKMDEAKREQLEEEEEDAKQVRDARERPAEKTGDKDKDYRFQITKQIDKASLDRMQGLTSAIRSSPSWQESNRLSPEAKLKSASGGGVAAANRTESFLTLTFRGVYIVGYESGNDGQRSAAGNCRFLLPNLRNERCPAARLRRRGEKPQRQSAGISVRRSSKFVSADAEG